MKDMYNIITVSQNREEIASTISNLFNALCIDTGEKFRMWLCLRDAITNTLVAYADAAKNDSYIAYYYNMLYTKNSEFSNAFYNRH